MLVVPDLKMSLIIRWIRHLISDKLEALRTLLDAEV